VNNNTNESVFHIPQFSDDVIHGRASVIEADSSLFFLKKRQRSSPLLLLGRVNGDSRDRVGGAEPVGINFRLGFEDNPNPASTLH
jgi:hypothetical protein